MLKKILCIVLVVAIVGAAVGFVIYDNVGKTYDYADKDFAKYLGMTLTPEEIEALGLDLSEYNDPKQLVATDDEVLYKIAEALSGIETDSKVTMEGGKLAKFDELTFLYYVTDKDGNVISDPTLMNIDADSKNKPTFQIYQDPDVKDDVYAALSGMLSADLVDRDYHIFSVYKNGKVEANDTIWVEYTVTVNDNAETSVTYKYQKTTLAGLDSLKAGDRTLAGLTKAFTDKQTELVNAGDASKVPNIIGNATDFQNLTIDEEGVKVSMKVLFASRAVATKGDIAENDTVYFSYTKKDDGTSATATQLVTTKNAAGEAEMLRIFKDAAFYTQLMALKLDDASSKEITVTVDGTETVYVVTIDYAIPADPTLARDGVIPADPYIKVSTQYGETDEVKYDATGAEIEGSSLKDAEVDVYMYILSGYTFDLDEFETYYEDLAYTSTGVEEADAYFKAYADYKAAEKALSDEQAKSEPDTEKVSELEEKKNSARTAYENAQKAYSKKVDGEEALRTDVVADIRREFEDSKRKLAQIDVNNECAYGIASIVWNALLDEIEDAGNVTYPSKALRLAKEGILDAHKKTYYTNRNSEGYKEYKTFNSYLVNSVYADQDKDAAIETEAKRDVLENMLVYYLADVYDESLTEDELKDIEFTKTFYEAYGMTFPAGYLESMETGILFDKVMRTIAEQLVPEVEIESLQTTTTTETETE